MTRRHKTKYKVQLCILPCLLLYYQDSLNSNLVFNLTYRNPPRKQYSQLKCSGCYAENYLELESKMLEIVNIESWIKAYVFLLPSLQIRTPHGKALYFNSNRVFKCTTIRVRPSEESSNILLLKRFPLLLNKLLIFSSQSKTWDPNLQKLFYVVHIAQA